MKTPTTLGCQMIGIISIANFSSFFFIRTDKRDFWSILRILIEPGFEPDLNQGYFISRIKPLKGLNLVGFFWKIMSSIFYRWINYRIRKFIEDNMLFISIFETFFEFFDSF